MKVYRSEKSGRAIRETCDRLLSAWGAGLLRKTNRAEHGTWSVQGQHKREALMASLFYTAGPVVTEFIFCLISGWSGSLRYICFLCAGLT